MAAVPLAFPISRSAWRAALTAAVSTEVRSFLLTRIGRPQVLLWLVNVCALLPGGHVYVELPRVAPPRDCEFTVPDGGSGAAIHLRAGDAVWLIDGGVSSPTGSLPCPICDARNDSLDAFFLTDGDAQNRLRHHTDRRFDPASHLRLTGSGPFLDP